MLDAIQSITVTESQAIPDSYYSSHIGKREFSRNPVYCGCFVYATSEYVYMITYMRNWKDADGARDEFYNIYKSAKYDRISIYNESELPAAETVTKSANNTRTDVAAINLSNMTLDELIKLREQVTMAMWETDEWQEVEVPIGVYQVGVDIPAGHWTIKCAPAFGFAYIGWGENLRDNGRNIKTTGRYDTSLVYSADSINEGIGPLEYSFEARDGEYIVINYSNVIFTPFAGKPDLGFK